MCEECKRGQAKRNGMGMGRIGEDKGGEKVRA
jgi:hypothetical protein